MPNERQSHLLKKCEAALGRQEFFSFYQELIKELKSIQVGVWSFDDDIPRCLFIRHLQNPLFGEVAKTIYLAGWYQHDPVLKEVKALEVGTRIIESFRETKDKYPEEFLRAFSSIFKENNPEFGFSDRITLLAATPTLRMVMHLYFDDTREIDQELFPTFVDLSIRHFSAAPQLTATYEPEPHPVLAKLSDREREVCLGILSGKKAERIAADMDIAASTVVTYRRRAYEKLGINTRASLFELCQF
ncbi:helix-turn-helix transcriptional regulator [uncultured Cohaesibacter sp.]|uniref:helix-turn-helix transcriptional regulator n=1 Tax=uncultured Cohaesibacter sp. TaxID=1002546 RepID=UPI002AAA7A6A|nr:helix-turn-helix transcriptional regulator [uncultured Cohaesibacter sp.]